MASSGSGGGGEKSGSLFSRLIHKSKGKSKVDQSNSQEIQQYQSEPPTIDINAMIEAQLEDDDDEVQIQETIHTQESHHVIQEQDEVKRATSDIFKVHFTKRRQTENIFDVICNYCGQLYKFKVGGGYGTFRRHLEQKHPDKIGYDKTQTQISGYATSRPHPLFQYSDKKNKEELAKMVSMEHLSFSFGEKVGFVNYCQNALNPSAKRIPRNTLKREIYVQYKKGKKELRNMFYMMNGRVSICSDIWSDHWTHIFIWV
jgi:hypothetical protein